MATLLSEAHPALPHSVRGGSFLTLRLPQSQPQGHPRTRFDTSGRQLEPNRDYIRRSHDLDLGRHLHGYPHKTLGSVLRIRKTKQCGGGPMSKTWTITLKMFMSISWATEYGALFSGER